jgi:hypothetical protein
MITRGRVGADERLFFFELEGPPAVVAGVVRAVDELGKKVGAGTE